MTQAYSQDIPGTIHIRDIIDLDFLQKFQDNFSEAFGVASIAVDLEGNPITEPSGFTDFCMKLVRNSETGLNRCKKCDAQGGQQASHSGKPAIYDCHAGLVDFAAPIMLDGRQIGSMLGGQVLTAAPDVNEIRNIAAEIKVDPDQMERAVNKIRPLSRDQVERAADLLYLVAGNVSAMGFQKNRVKTSVQVLNSNLGQITGAIQQMAAFSDQVAHNQTLLNHQIQEIHQLSTQINLIVDTIKQVTQRTKMLGINASIEAARAREAGLGFTIVAREIQKLSDDSRTMTEKINAFTTHIQDAIKKTEQMADDNLTASQQQSAAAQEVSASIEEMSNVASHLIALVQN